MLFGYPAVEAPTSRRSRDSAETTKGNAKCRLFELLRYAVVGDLRDPVVRHEDVLRLDIPMVPPSILCEYQRLKYGTSHRRVEVFPSHWSVFRDPFCQVTVYPLQYHVEPIVIGTSIIQCDDIRVFRQISERRMLSVEALLPTKVIAAG
jgi:hypothetical protein